MVNPAARVNAKRGGINIDIIGTKQIRLEKDMVLRGIDKVEDAISLYYGDADDFIRGLFFDIRRDLEKQEYYMNSFGWGVPQLFLKSSLIVRALDSTGELLLLSFNIFNEQGIGIKIASHMEVRPALKEIVIRIHVEPDYKTNKFGFDFDEIVYDLRRGPIKDLKMSGERNWRQLFSAKMTLALKSIKMKNSGSWFMLVVLPDLFRQARETSFGKKPVQ
jgi:hypothetical protein